MHLQLPIVDASESVAALRPGDNPPALSVVVVAVYDIREITRCLQALERQVNRPAMEVLVVHHAGCGDVSPLRERFTTVQFHCAARSATQADMLALGLAHATGDIVALTVDHCTVDEHWCARVVAAHREPFAAVGGPLEIGDQADTAVNWAVHFYDYCSYGYYQNPVRRGPARDLSDCNVSYKRHVLTAMGGAWADGFNVPLVNRRLLTSGETLWFAPDLLVHQHRNISCSRAARVAYRRGRAFASVRLATFTSIQRMVRTAVSPLLPLALTGKLVVNMSQRKAHLGALARAFPFVVLFSLFWAWGEFLGLLLGRPDYRVSVTEE
jgi:hypothetical protein